MHKIQKKILLQQYSKITTWIFSGQKNIGKFEVAKSFAKWLLKDESLADLLIINEVKIKIEHTKKLQEFFSLTSCSSKYKVAVINNFENATVKAFNSLLKLLEELEKNSVIILIANNLYKIASTIKSRCFILKFYPIETNYSSELIEDYKDILNSIINNAVIERNIIEGDLYHAIYLAFNRIIKFKANILENEIFTGEFLKLQQVQKDLIFWHYKFMKFSKAINAYKNLSLHWEYLNSTIF